MEKVSKFISMEGNGEEMDVNEKTGNVGGVENGTTNLENIGGTEFKVCGKNTNLPVETSFWSKLKGVFTHEIKVELTPYQQRVEDEINEFLHQEITWQSFKNFLFQDITFGSKDNA